MSEHINENAGNLPPVNAQGNSLWAERKLSPVKDSFVLTDGVAECVNDDEIIKLCRKLVSSSRIVVFIKGSRSVHGAPGFKLLTIPSHGSQLLYEHLSSLSCF